MAWCMRIGFRLLKRNIGAGRAFCNFILAPRKKIIVYFLLLIFFLLIITYITMATSQFQREIGMEEKLAWMRTRLDFLESQNLKHLEQVIELHTKASRDALPEINHKLHTTLSPEVQDLLKNMTGSKAASGLNPEDIPDLKTVFVHQLLPYLLNSPRSLKPAYHMKSGRNFFDVVIGIPTVKREKEDYLTITISSLIDGLRPNFLNSTLIVVIVGETDLKYVLTKARQIESQYPREVYDGLIEVISPSAAYYPDFDALPDTLGDSHKRVKWRTKQNLDAIYLMAYAQSKGTYYLMLEDDVVAKDNFMQEIKVFTATTTASNPNWFFIEYCRVGGIGKLFKSADLIHFVTYMQLFYNNLPIDWLLESYLADRVCTVDRTSKACKESKDKIRPRFKTSLFQHIGIFSSLPGKIQKVKDSKFGAIPKFYPHENPPLVKIKSDIEAHLDYTLQKAYNGEKYFWGVKPKKGDLIEFWFKKPTNITRFLFRSGNVEHVSDKFYDTVVEVLPQNSNGTFTPVGSFDEFGLADGEVKMGPLTAIRLRINKESKNWAILSEIELRTTEPADSI